jgi:hypothetical protein
VDALLLAVPMLASCLCAVTLRVRHPVLVAGSALGGLAVHGGMVFWAYYLLSGDGRYVGAALFALDVLIIAALLVRGGAAPLRAVAFLALPAALVVTSALFVVSFGLMKGGASTPVQTAQTRYLSLTLPVDNAIPLLLAKAVESDVRPLPDPLYSNWSSSDRPPLQAGIYLAAVSVVGHDASEMQYLIVGAILQSLWILGIWAFFVAARTDPRLAAVTTASILFSGFTIVNSFYVWPKLLSAAFLLVVAAGLLTPRNRGILSGRGSGVILGLNIGGALLAHGGALLALFALVLVALATKKAPTWRVGGLAVLTAATLLAPWTAYQKYVDPPGDKLLKLQVAGNPNIDDPRPLGREIVDHYRQIGFRSAVHNKIENLAEPFRGARAGVHDVLRVLESHAGVEGITKTERGSAILDFRAEQFYRLVPTLGLMALGPILLTLRALSRRRHRCRMVVDDHARLLLSLALYIVLGLVTWALILFGPATTVLHAGTYLLPLLAFVLCVGSWWKLTRQLTVALVVAQGLASLYLYKDPAGFSPRLDGSVVAVFLSSIIALAAILLVAARRAVSTAPCLFIRS